MSQTEVPLGAILIEAYGNCLDNALRVYEHGSTRYLYIINGRDYEIFTEKELTPRALQTYQNFKARAAMHVIKLRKRGVNRS